jgi:hypothetical protein
MCAGTHGDIKPKTRRDQQKNKLNRLAFAHGATTLYLPNEKDF